MRSLKTRKFSPNWGLTMERRQGLVIQKIAGHARRSSKIIASVLGIDEILLQLKPDDVTVLHGYAVDLSNSGIIFEGADPQAALANYQKALVIDRKVSQISPDVPASAPYCNRLRLDRQRVRCHR